MHLPLNALRAFEASARHLNLTRAAEELHVTQTAVSQHIRKLEDRLGKPLFRRLPRGLALTDEGQALLPVVVESFGNLERALEKLGDTRPRLVCHLDLVAPARAATAGHAKAQPQRGRVQLQEALYAGAGRIAQ